ncbi:hypothetical protein QLQ12_39620 [Actinoplanes sp. NEAU-A12]|uniref:Uncharacterized protein n=1 Tax=Actinoplanes sandaracinus TaxID=3045177 RepID=A0ABT6WYA4_9ACTN|nr:hypothetical protein [Actinoplanes sandaracinus]MDI6104718.1 hypothetical protein [Actinoplanes sandaracinus]
MSDPSTSQQPSAAIRWAVACGIFLAAESALRVFWIAGGRWGYTACDRTDSGDVAGGCGADRVAVLPFWPGWGALAAGAVLAVVVGWALRSPGRAAATAAWVAATLITVAAFPLHLLFEIPAALAGRPSDWRDLGARLALVAGGVLFAGLANACGPRRGPRAPGYRPVPRWTRRWAYAAVALPGIGWTLPHVLWVLGVPFGMSGQKLADAQRDLATPTGVAIAVVPPLAGLLVLGLVQRWGQQFPDWVPVLGGRPVPRLLAVIPAGLVAIALVTYGTLSAAVLAGQLISGAHEWADVREGWAATATLLVFLGWGVALGVTTAGYARTTGGGTGRTGETPARPGPSPVRNPGSRA